jgi:hypothetical protein
MTGYCENERVDALKIVKVVSRCYFCLEGYPGEIFFVDAISRHRSRVTGVGAP